MSFLHSLDQFLLGDPEEGPKPINTVVRDNNSTSSGTTTLTPTNSQSSTNAPIPTNDSGNGSNGRINIGATAGGATRDLGSPMIFVSDLTHPTVFVSSVVLFAIVAVAVFIYIRRRRQKPAEKPQPQCPELDPHEPRQPSMYGSLLTVTPYVSLSWGAELGDVSLPLFLEPLRSIDVPF